MTDSPDPIQFHGGRVTLYHGDARDVLRGLEDNSVDSVCCDPPYALDQMTKRYSSKNARPCGQGKDGSFRRLTRGFMGQAWDVGDTAFDPEFWAEVLRVLKPGGHLCAFGGTRTYHRLVCAIEDAGFEIRDALTWAYGAGFPKSHDIAVAIAKHFDPEWKTGMPMPEEAIELAGYGTALKPATEIICLARKPLSEKTIAGNVLRWGCGGLNIDATRIACGTEHMRGAVRGSSNGVLSDIRGKKDFVATDSPLGRWAANLLHDGSEEVLACFPESDAVGYRANPSKAEGAIFGNCNNPVGERGYNDIGSAARFFASFPLTEDDKRIFYSAKADFFDRAGSSHPTVKPVALMQWLVRLITPLGGTCLDMFAGTGTTGEACYREGMQCILIEREAAYIADIKRRMELMTCGPAERSRESIKARGLTADAGPLFGET